MKKALSQSEIIKKIQHYCAYQERSITEVEKKLMGLGVAESDLSEIILELKNENFINEERFVKAFVNGKSNQKKWGKNKIFVALKKLNISDELIFQTLHKLNNENYQNQISQLLEKKDKEIKDKEIFVRKQKLIKYLIGKGFETDLVLQWVDKKYSD